MWIVHERTPFKDFVVCAAPYVFSVLLRKKTERNKANVDESLILHFFTKNHPITHFNHNSSFLTFTTKILWIHYSCLARKINPEKYILVNIYLKRKVNLHMAQVKQAKWNGLSLAFLQIFTLQSEWRRFGHENKEIMRALNFWRLPLVYFSSYVIFC